VYCLKVRFLKAVKCNNFLPYDLSLYDCGPRKRARVTLKKKRFALQRKSVALKRACCGEEEEEYCCCYCCFCHGAEKFL